MELKIGMWMIKKIGNGNVIDGWDWVFKNKKI